MNSTISRARWMLALDMAKIARTESIRTQFCRIAVYYQGMYVMQLAEEKIRGQKC